MSRRATLPAIRPEVIESLVHPIPGSRGGGDVQLVVRVSVGTDDDSPADEHPHPVEAVLAEVSPMPKRAGATAVAAGNADLVRFCAELTRTTSWTSPPPRVPGIGCTSDSRTSGRITGNVARRLMPRR